MSPNRISAKPLARRLVVPGVAAAAALAVTLAPLVVARPTASGTRVRVADRAGLGAQAPVSATETITPSATQAISATAVPTATPSASPSPSATRTPTIGPRPTRTSSPTSGPSPTATVSFRMALPFAANAPAFEAGEIATGVQIQNLDLVSAIALEVDLLDETGRVRHSIAQTVPAGAAPNLYLPSFGTQNGLPPGLYSLVVRSTGGVGAIVRTDWRTTGAAAISSSGGFASRATVPIFERLTDGRSSVLSIQNVRHFTATVAVTVFDGTLPLPRAQLEFAVGPYAARHIFAANEAALQPLGAFQGWAEVSSRVALSVVHHSVSTRRTSGPRVAYADWVSDSTSTEDLFVPLFRSGQRVLGGRERLDTRIIASNPSATVPVTVEMTYRGSQHPDASAACRGGTFRHPVVAIPPRGVHVFDQAQGGGHDIPSNCFGTARLGTGDGVHGIAAQVLDLTDNGRLVSAYGAVPGSSSGTRKYLPLFRRAYAGLTTGIQVMNLSHLPASVRVDFTATDPRTNETRPISCGTECTQAVPALGSATFWPGSISAIPDGTFGSAVVHSDRHVVVLVNDYPLVAGRDPAIYLGIP